MFPVGSEVCGRLFWGRLPCLAHVGCLFHPNRQMDFGGHIEPIMGEFGPQKLPGRAIFRKFFGTDGFARPVLGSRKGAATGKTPLYVLPALVLWCSYVKYTTMVNNESGSPALGDELMNPTLRKSIAAVSHPLTWLAVLTLLLNDHLFRVYWPSWLTGKLGDAAWLFAAPLALLLILSVLLPRYARHLPAVSFGLVGGVYVLGNTWPAFLAWLGGLISQVFGFPVLMISDLGDLLALPALAGSYLFWRRVDVPLRLASPRKDLAGFATLLIAVLTIANSPSPIRGVDLLGVENGVIIACSHSSEYTSIDGGLTWMPERIPWRCPPALRGNLTITEAGQEVYLRYNYETRAIERSVDGEIWEVEYQIQPASQAEAALYDQIYQSYDVLRQGVDDMVFDPVSGNVIAAVGVEGILVRTPDRIWQPVGVDTYSPLRVNSLNAVWILLKGELCLAVLLGLLLFGTSALKIKWRYGYFVLLAAGSLAWLISCMIGSALNNTIPILASWGMIVSAVFILPAAGIALKWFLKQPRRTLVLAFSTAFGGALIFFVAFVLWAVDFIHDYYTAMLIGIGFALIDLVLLLIFIRPAPVEHAPATDVME